MAGKREWACGSRGLVFSWVPLELEFGSRGVSYGPQAGGTRLQACCFTRVLFCIFSLEKNVYYNSWI